MTSHQSNQPCQSSVRLGGSRPKRRMSRREARSAAPACGQRLLDAGHTASARPGWCRGARQVALIRGCPPRSVIVDRPVAVWLTSWTVLCRAPCEAWLKRGLPIARSSGARPREPWIGRGTGGAAHGQDDHRCGSAQGLGHHRGRRPARDARRDGPVPDRPRRLPGPDAVREAVAAADLGRRGRRRRGPAVGVAAGPRRRTRHRRPREARRAGAGVRHRAGPQDRRHRRPLDRRRRRAYPRPARTGPAGRGPGGDAAAGRPARRGRPPTGADRQPAAPAADRADPRRCPQAGPVRAAGSPDPDRCPAAGSGRGHPTAAGDGPGR